MNLRLLALAGLTMAALALSASAQKDKDDKKDKDKPKAVVYKTPEDCFNAFAKAIVKDDHKTWIGCLAPAAHQELTGMFGVEFSSQRSKLADLPAEQRDAVMKVLKPLFDTMDKHGLTEKAVKDAKKGDDDKERAKAVAKLVKDQEAFLVEAFKVIEKLNPNPKEKKEPKLKDLKIDGDKATAKMTSPENADKEEAVQFVKVNGSWRMLPDFKAGK